MSTAPPTSQLQSQLLNKQLSLAALLKGKDTALLKSRTPPIAAKPSRQTKLNPSLASQLAKPTTTVPPSLPLPSYSQALQQGQTIVSHYTNIFF